MDRDQESILADKIRELAKEHGIGQIAKKLHMDHETVGSIMTEHGISCPPRKGKSTVPQELWDQWDAMHRLYGREKV